MRHRPQTAADVVGIAAQFRPLHLCHWTALPLDSDVDVNAEIRARTAAERPVARQNDVAVLVPVRAHTAGSIEVALRLACVYRPHVWCVLIARTTILACSGP